MEKGKKINKILSSKGRISRSSYLVTLAVLFVCFYASSIIVFILGDLMGVGSTPISLSLLMLYLGIMILWVAAAAGAKRCHDIGRSGWWQLIPLYFIVLMFKKGMECENEYGPNPKRSEVLFG